MEGSALLLLAWLFADVARDLALGPSQGRVPAISLQKLCFAAAFLGAAILGSAYCSNIEQTRTVFQRVAILGLVLSAFVALQLLNWDVKSLAAWSGDASRPSGIYTNANRFAVLMSCCWMCGCAILLSLFIDSRGRWRSHLRNIVLLGIAATAIGVCIALTLSRLTMLATAAALFLMSLVYIFVQKRNQQDEGFEQPLQARLAPLVIPLVMIAGWGAWCLMVGNTQLRNRFADFGDSNPEGREAAISAAMPLLKAELLWGQGLGLFESTFTQVQPASLTGRWREAHSDWIQLAIEAGLPALVLALALAAFWLRSVWKKMSAEPKAALLLSFGAAAVLVVMICSAGDFPLREPATAMLVFFLAGALCGGTQEPYAPAPLRRAAAMLLAVIMLGGAFISGRNGIAYATSPWMGRIYCPTNYADQRGAWDKALSIDGGDPEILFRHASAVFAASAGSEAELARARDAIQSAQKLQPHDFRFPMLEAGIAEFAGDIDAAVSLRDLAAKLAPNNPQLREQNGRFYLRQAVVKAAPGEELHDWGLQKALDELRALLTVSPGHEADIIATLSLAGCLNTEIAQLWPGDDERARLKRALFFCSSNQWDMAERQLEKIQPGGAREKSFFHAIRGTLALKRRDFQRGRSEWKSALAERGSWNQELDFWLSSQAAELPAEASESIAGELSAELSAFPALSSKLAATLISDKRYSAADSLLEKVANRSPDLSAQWAELALEAGDAIAASDRARITYERGMFSPRWGAWYEQFRRKLEQQKSKPAP